MSGRYLTLPGAQFHASTAKPKAVATSYVAPASSTMVATAPAPTPPAPEVYSSKCLSRCYSVGGKTDSDASYQTATISYLSTSCDLCGANSGGSTPVQQCCTLAETLFQGNTTYDAVTPSGLDIVGNDYTLQLDRDPDDIPTPVACGIWPTNASVPSTPNAAGANLQIHAQDSTDTHGFTLAGNLSILGGNASTGVAGGVTITAGSCSTVNPMGPTANVPGGIAITAGSSNGCVVAGSITMTCGDAIGTIGLGGTVTVVAGDALTTTGDGGSVTVSCGSASQQGAGGLLEFLGGNGGSTGNPTDGTASMGGGVLIEAGAADATATVGGNGGFIKLIAGDSNDVGSTVGTVGGTVLIDAGSVQNPATALGFGGNIFMEPGNNGFIVTPGTPNVYAGTGQVVISGTRTGATPAAGSAQLTSDQGIAPFATTTSFDGSATALTGSSDMNGRIQWSGNPDEGIDNGDTLSLQYVQSYASEFVADPIVVITIYDTSVDPTHLAQLSNLYLIVSASTVSGFTITNIGGQAQIDATNINYIVIGRGYDNQ